MCRVRNVAIDSPYKDMPHLAVVHTPCLPSSPVYQSACQRTPVVLKASTSNAIIKDKQFNGKATLYCVYYTHG